MHRPSKSLPRRLVIIINEVAPGKGTYRAYTLSRLKHEAPKLFERVVAGKMSANKAASDAGFRAKPSPFDQVSKLIEKHVESFTNAEKRKLTAMLAK